MKIIFLEDWPDVCDKSGKFSIRGVSHGSQGMTLIEITSVEIDRFHPSSRIFITATYTDSCDHLIGTRLCEEEFASCDVATVRMQTGIEIMRNSQSEAFAQRLIDSQKAKATK